MGERHDRVWWQSTVSRWRESGQTSEQFGAANGVHPSTLKWWGGLLRRHEAARAPALSLLRVEVAPAVVERETLTALVGPAELRIVVGTDAQYVGAVVAAIARAAARC
jgi:hypothetical protein